MIDRPTGGERAVLVHIYFPTENMQEDLVEFQELAVSAGANVIETITGTRQAPESKYFVGSGKANEICHAVSLHRAELVIFNHALTPAQERNLERLLKCRVVDRTGLILDIFAQRARSFEGKLQVELAMLKHLATRLVRGWTHLERQRGGIGLRGPGETQLETDRRLIRIRIKLVTERLIKVRKQREQGRRARKKALMPTVALVGYTNAGKSTLFNKLTGADTYVAHRLFATLDPTLRRLELSEIGAIIIADTVGFIRHLPHDLVEAFRATLQEVAEADLLLHVIDAHDKNRQANITQVNNVLKSIDADSVPQLLVYNKIDLCAHTEPRLDQDQETGIPRVWVSALAEKGLDFLKKAMIVVLSKNIVQREIVLAPQEARLRAELYQMGAVVAEKIDDDGQCHLVVRMAVSYWNKLGLQKDPPLPPQRNEK